MRRAFIMGSNGPAHLSPLRYVMKDIERMRITLSGVRAQFQVVVPNRETNIFEVRKQLAFVAEACTSEDTFICYFSGHGILGKGGTLTLLWDNTELDRLLTTALPVSDILHILTYCKAANKLLILDCCHAGAAMDMLGAKNAVGVPVQELKIRSDNYVVLMASERFEQAREVEILQGSFLSTHIASALRENFNEADRDHDGKLSLQELMQWLEKKTRLHNQQFPDDRVPYPYLFGRQKGIFYLTSHTLDWMPHEIVWADGSAMVVLPLQTGEKKAFCISKYPITNSQYKRFVEETNYREPCGRHFYPVGANQRAKNRWHGPFYPWREAEFQDPNQPVVCVSYRDAIQYCEWVNRRLFTNRTTHLPSLIEWNIAAFGTPAPFLHPDTWLIQSQHIHHNTIAPAPVDQTGIRSNSRGISDMIGNVWEWGVEATEVDVNQVITLYKDNPLALRSISTLLSELHFASEVRGGGFLDNLYEMKISLPVFLLADQANTCHSDLGFRIACTIDIADLPQEVQQRLLFCPSLNTLERSQKSPLHQQRGHIVQKTHTPSEFSQFLEELRTSRHLSKKDLALRSSLTTGYVSSLTRGEAAKPSKEVVEALANALALDPETRQKLFLVAGY